MVRVIQAQNRVCAIICLVDIEIGGGKAGDKRTCFGKFRVTGNRLVMNDRADSRRPIRKCPVIAVIYAALHFALKPLENTETAATPA